MYVGGREGREGRREGCQRAGWVVWRGVCGLTGWSVRLFGRGVGCAFSSGALCNPPLYLQCMPVLFSFYFFLFLLI